MAIRIGVYDFFAYTVPGGLYLTVLIYLCTIFGLIAVDSQSLNNLSAIQILVLAVLAYISGLIFDPVAKKWYQIFKPKGLSKKVLDDFRKKYASLDVKFQLGDWPILLTYLRQNASDVAADIDKYNATNIMLRNISLSLILLSAIEITQFFRTSFLIVHLVLSVVFVIASIVTVRESVKFATWFYSATYEAIAAHGLEISDFVKQKRTTGSTEGTSNT
jgi:hypothetical protein